MAFRNPLRTLPVSAIYGDFPAARISGQLTDAQIAQVSATKLAGQVLDAQIAAIGAAKLTGTVADAQIAALSAAKLTGTVSNAQIAAVAAGKVTGQLTNAQLAAIDAAKVTGQLSAAQIASVNAVALSGQLTASQITSLTAAQITGTLTASQIAAVSAAAITGQLAGTQLAANSIDGKSINGATITGGTFQTSSSTTAQRWVLKSTGANTLYGFTGDASELGSGSLVISTDSANLLLTLSGPAGSGNSGAPALTLSCPKTGTAAAYANLLSSAGLSWMNDLTGVTTWAVTRPGSKSTRIHWQSLSGTTDSNGICTATHTAGFDPGVILVQHRVGTTSPNLNVVPVSGGTTSTTIQYRARVADTGVAPATGTAVGVYALMME